MEKNKLGKIPPKYKIWTLLHDYRFNSILVRSFILILFVLFLTFMGITMIVRNEMNILLTKEIGNMNIQNLDKTQERLDAIVHEVEQIAVQLSLDSDIMLFLLPGTNDLFNESAMRKTWEKLIMYAGISDYIDSIYVYSNKNRMIVTTETGGSIDDFSDMTWYDNLMEREYEPARIVCRLKENKYPYVLSYIQPMRLTQMQYLGGIIINLDMDKISELAVSSADGYNENLLIVDKRNNILFSTKESDLTKKFSEMEYYEQINMEDDGYQIIDGLDKQIVAVSSSDMLGWKYISMVSMERYYNDMHNTKTFYFVLFLFIFIVSILAALIIALYCYTPVKNIINLLENPNLGSDFNDSKLELRKDELQEIVLNIVRNLYSNKKMKEEINQYVKIIDKAQVTALQAQISPHFLYNTLENIRWKAINICQGDNEVSQTILNLSQMLRISLDNERQIITVEEEIKNAKLYIDILQLRYEDKLKVTWDVQELALTLPIVKISLQPLIENAVYHGIKPKRGSGTIKIKIRKLTKSLLVRVEDDGIGMKQEELDKLNEMMSEKYLLDENHIGICNINQRIRLLLNNDAKLTVRSIENVGTTVEMDIPITLGDVV